MSNRHPRVARMLAALPPAPLTAVLRQLEFTSDLDGQMELISAAWLIHAEGGPTPDEISRELRDQMMRSGRDQRAAGRAADVAALAGGDDPASLLEAQQAARVWQPRPATLGGTAVQAFAVATAARRCWRSVRSVQTGMHCRWLAEQAGQMVLAGLPKVSDVYRPRHARGAK